MPIYCQKSVHSLRNQQLSCRCFVKKTSISKNTMFSCPFFSVFYEKNPFAFMQKIGQKNVNSVKITVYYGLKVNRMPLFSEFFQKNYGSHAHILLKIKQLSCPYFVKKPSILSKTWCSHVIFAKLFIKTPTVMPIFGRKTSIL